MGLDYDKKEFLTKMTKTSEVFLEAFRNLEVKPLPLCENKDILNTKDTKVTKGKPFIFYSDYFVYFVSFVVKSFSTCPS